MATQSVTPSDRLTLTIILAAVVHGLVILGITFNPFGDEIIRPAPAIDVILVNSQSEKAPEEADFNAQTNQIGGGKSQKAERPSEVFTTEIPAPVPGVAPIDQSPHNQQRQTKPDETILTSTQAEQKVISEKQPQPIDKQPQPDANELVQNALIMARFAAEINDTPNLNSRGPREKIITPSTKSIIGANYLQSWTKKVERVGRQNFPNELVHQGLKYELEMDVTIDATGQIVKITVLRSSGNQAVDQAAKRVVRLASPYAPFPPEMRKDTDIVHIIRKWTYENK